ncbi:MAG TPA: iron-sulfur cluster insertion protein ErpA [Stellaceae bacterium]|nr:iron-sulfur cluster insertion protein ErpA [Stellaceae bacterium]
MWIIQVESHSALRSKARKMRNLSAGPGAGSRPRPPGNTRSIESLSFDTPPAMIKYTGSGSRARWSAEHMAEVMDAAGERAIVVSESAAKRIAALKIQEDAAEAFLRIAVSGGGCSGFQYGISFDDRKNDDDFVFERDGIAVIVDDTSLDLLNGAELDFVEDLMGASFQIRNPNAASSCGCGNSFSIA